MLNKESKLIEDTTERIPMPAENEGLRLAKPILLKLLQHGIREKMGLKTVTVLDVGSLSPVTGIMTVSVDWGVEK